MKTAFSVPTPARHALLVQDFLEHSAERLPSKTALVCDGQRLTYAQVDEMANRLAHALIAGGVVRGDRVGLFLHNSVELAVGIFAILKAGAVFVAINATTKRDKLHYILNNCRATALIADVRADLSGLIEDSNSAVPSLRCVILAGKGTVEGAGAHCVAWEAALSKSDAKRPRR